jgi:hypothetical protein
LSDTSEGSARGPSFLPAVEPLTFTIAIEGCAPFPCSAREPVLVAMALRARAGLLRGRVIKAAPGCRRGRCGICRVQVTDGTYDHAPDGLEQLSEDERADRIALACCLLPSSDLRLRPLAPVPRGSGP